MRHFISSVAKAAHPRGMRSTTGPGALVAAASFPLPGPPGSLPAVATTVDVAAIASAANDDERPAAGARVQAARGLHWRFLQNAKEEESNKVDGPREQCDTGSSHGSSAGQKACHMETLWRRGAGLDLAVEAGVAPVVLPWQTPFYHVAAATRCRSRLQSPYGLPTPRPVSSSYRSQRTYSFHDLDCLLLAATPI